MSRGERGQGHDPCSVHEFWENAVIRAFAITGNRVIPEPHGTGEWVVPFAGNTVDEVLITQLEVEG